MNDKIKEAFERYWNSLASDGTESEDLLRHCFHAATNAYRAGYLAHQKEAAEQKPVAEYDHTGTVEWLTYPPDLLSGGSLYAAPVDQSKRIAELEAELSQLRTKPLHYRLSAAQAENLKLRDALMWVDKYVACALSGTIKQLITTPSDNSALESLLEAERVKVAEACAKVCDTKIGIEIFKTQSACAREIRNGEWKGFVK